MPEKTLQQIPRNVRDLYEKGNAALQRQNLDYALALFGQALQNEPGFYDCRESLRAAQFRKAWDPLESTCRHASLSIL